MGKRIHSQFNHLSHFHSQRYLSFRQEYFMTLGLDDDEASKLHLKYYATYGLALRGLTRHHKVGEYWMSYTHICTIVICDKIHWNLMQNAMDPYRSKRCCHRILLCESYFKTSTEQSVASGL